MFFDDFNNVYLYQRSGSLAFMNEYLMFSDNDFFINLNDLNFTDFRVFRFEQSLSSTWPNIIAF